MLAMKAACTEIWCGGRIFGQLRYKTNKIKVSLLEMIAVQYLVTTAAFTLRINFYCVNTPTFRGMKKANCRQIRAKYVCCQLRNIRNPMC